MVYRPLRIPVWLVAAALVATSVIGSSARPAAKPDVQPTFRIVTPGVSEVVTEEVTPEIARNLHMSQETGVLVSDVLFSPLLPGDVILSINGHPVGCQKELEAQLAQVSFGQPLYMEVLRDGRLQTVSVQLLRPTILQGSADIRGIRVAG